jgi:hypothetical protein
MPVRELFVSLHHRQSMHHSINDQKPIKNFSKKA